MGLDITAYQHLVPADLEDDEEEVAVLADDIVITERVWPGRTQGLSPVNLTVAPDSTVRSLRIGSYSSYGDWRRELCKLVYQVDLDTLWNEKRQSGAFVELLDFSDCDGVLGPQICGKLAQDFADYQDKADGFGNIWFSEIYTKLRRAFDLAAGPNGAVKFH